jgi:membrane associated rhomboid family serine protease
VATVALLALNLLVFFYQALLAWPQEEMFILNLGLVPGWVTGDALQPLPSDFLPRPLTLVTSMFLHADIFHILGNLLYLWIFGSRLEDVLRPFRFLLFYFTGGVLAALAQVLAEPVSMIPVVGASGAVAAVLGGYVVLHPRSRVSVLLWFLFFLQVVRVPAVLLLGLWFLLQVLGVGGPGVAWLAHIGGFVAGMAMVKPLTPRPKRL